MLREFDILEQTYIDDGIGSYTTTKLFKKVSGYLDLLDGSDRNSIENSVIEESTHILIIPNYVEGITNEMLVSFNGKLYNIDYSDNPLEANHHNELYLSFSDTISEERYNERY